MSMDFDSLLYSLVIGGTIVWSVVKNFKKAEKQRQAQKERSRPITVETDDTVEEVRPKRRMTKGAVQPDPNKEYFSYETMSERDFEQAFSENVEENKHFAAAAETPHPDIHLNMDEEEIYKGVVWSEILNRKY